MLKLDISGNDEKQQKTETSLTNASVFCCGLPLSIIFGIV